MTGTTSPADRRDNGRRTVSGTVERVLFERESDGFAILRLRPAEGGEPVVLVGDLAGLAAGEAVRVTGREERSPGWGPRLRVDRVEPVVPTSSEAIAGWLGSGVVKGVGPRLARRLLDRFGERLPEALEDPDRLRAVRGIGRGVAARLATFWRERRQERDLLVALQTAGIGPARAKRLLVTLGADAAARLAADPYRVAREVPGIGFRIADRLARSLGIGERDTVRVVAGCEHVLREAAEEGHSAVPEPRVRDAVAELLGPGLERTGAALEEAVRRGFVVRRCCAGESWLLLPELDRAEADIAADLARLAEGPLPWRPAGDADLGRLVAERLGPTLSAGQERGLATLLRHKLSVLTGGPGTGKTTLVRALLALLEDSGITIVLAAPTGRAARRLTETTGHPAQTLHRLLEAEPGQGFRRGRTRPLAADLLVVDESSMLDLPLARATLAALRDHAALVLVGDADQLPPIGPGQFLADLTASGRVPVVALEEIFRQAAESGIVAAAHRIRRGEPPSFEHDAARDCFGVRIQSSEDARRKLVELVAHRIPERFGLDPKRDVQVLVPTNRGTLGTCELNLLLQDVLDPAGAPSFEHGGCRFVLGAKVMQTENDNQREVYNGDIGLVVDLDARGRTLTVEVDGREVRYEGDQLDRLVPAYAVTVHKAQGSEYPAVVVLLAREHGRMLRRRLLYTAVTRAKRLLVLLAEPRALERAVASAEPPRGSLLLPRLLGRLEGEP